MFVMCNWTLGDSRSFTNLAKAIEESTKESKEDKITIIEQRLKNEEYHNFCHFDRLGNIITL